MASKAEVTMTPDRRVPWSPDWSKSYLPLTSIAKSAPTDDTSITSQSNTRLSENKLFDVNVFHHSSEEHSFHSDTEPHVNVSPIHCVTRNDKCICQKKSFMYNLRNLRNLRYTPTASTLYRSSSNKHTSAAVPQAHPPSSSHSS